jgi:hypothetical protein
VVKSSSCLVGLAGRRRVTSEEVRLISLRAPTTRPFRTWQRVAGLHSTAELPPVDSVGDEELAQRAERDVALAALCCSNHRAVEVMFMSERLLADAPSFTELTQRGSERLEIRLGASPRWHALTLRTQGCAYHSIEPNGVNHHGFEHDGVCSSKELTRVCALPTGVPFDTFSRNTPFTDHELEDRSVDDRQRHEHQD